MSKSLFTFVLFASASILPLAAHADTVDDFTLSGDSTTITYSLPSTVTFANFPLFNFFSQSAPTTINGVSGYNETGLYYDTEFFPKISMTLSVPSSVPGSPQLILTGPQFIDFNFESPVLGTATFIPGSYTLESLQFTNPLQPFSPPIFYDLTITPESTPPSVPEPSSLLLFATGIASLLYRVTKPRSPKTFL
jgi:PEP-CTERM motif